MSRWALFTHRAVLVDWMMTQTQPLRSASIVTVSPLSTWKVLPL